MIKALAIIVAWIDRLAQMWHDRKLRSEGREEAVIEATEKVKADVQVAEEIRAAVANDVAAHPDVLLEDDGFRRP